ncbi:hypothetical protein [uncultured Proteiniphilum sp.]|uniref:hypothetical protein n=1 Tax=uncultured Proteiniphilum sp. TaxID=497637 RepID=UPI002614879D|nr:hypothetical protein [uncultured Proteiniphilum sp.]
MNKRLKSTILLISLLTGFCCPAYGQDIGSVVFQDKHRQSSPIGISSDNFVFRIGYAYGPEYLFILFPPAKFGVEYHLPNLNIAYIGFDMSLNGLIAFWVQSGLYAGLKHKGFTLETKINHLIVESPEKETIKIWSVNPKIGIDYRMFYLKIGPYFPLHSYGSIELNKKPYVSLGGVLLNFDVGFRFPSNKK